MDNGCPHPCPPFFFPSMILNVVSEMDTCVQSASSVMLLRFCTLTFALRLVAIFLIVLLALVLYVVILLCSVFYFGCELL